MDTLSWQNHNLRDNIMSTIQKNSLLERVLALRAQRERERLAAQTPVAEATEEFIETIPSLQETHTAELHGTDRFGHSITYNTKQQEAINLISSGKSCVVIGAAGTGKTTCMKAATTALIQSGFSGILSAQGHKHLKEGTPGILICAYTRRAVANILRNLSLDLRDNCITIHKSLEYQPVYYTVIDQNTGQEKNTMRFEPTRGPGNPLPASIRTILYEESSMLGTDLYSEVLAASPHRPQEIFIGDIQQLPPVFGPAILGFKLLSLPVVELTEVYRQALESPIIALAHRVLSGHPIESEDYASWKYPGKLTIHPWKKRIKDIDACNTAAMFFIEAEKSGAYDPEEDMILLPFNKAFGTDEICKKIANHLAKKRGSDVYEIVAGFNKLYLSIGDKVLVEKEDAVITDIKPNPSYYGAKPQPHSKTLDYWGYDSVAHAPEVSDLGDISVDFLLAQVAANATEDRVHSASHIVTVRMLDSEQTLFLDKATELNSLLLAYALTVHKAQGSEWRKVFFVLHQSHATMVSRELLYTGITRAREELYIICEPDTFTKGILSQRVKGDTLEEKAEYFKGKVGNGFDISLIENGNGNGN